MNKIIFDKLSKIASDLEDIGGELYIEYTRKDSNALEDRTEVIRAMDTLEYLLVEYEDENGEFLYENNE